MLQFLLADYIDILMISESKFDGTFPSLQFQHRDRIPDRLDRNNRRGQILSAFIKTLFPMILKYY